MNKIDFEKDSFDKLLGYHIAMAEIMELCADKSEEATMEHTRTKSNLIGGPTKKHHELNGRAMAATEICQHSFKRGRKSFEARKRIMKEMGVE